MLILDSIMRSLRLDAAYGERGEISRVRLSSPTPVKKPDGRTMRISTFIGQDQETGEFRMMTK